jgi:cell division cycle 20-like protein 1, cofactor of APC complex
MPAAVNWSRTGKFLAAGTLSGVVQVWDVNSQKLVRSFEGHEGRVGALTWNS